MHREARKETGLTFYRRDRAYPGYTLYAPLVGQGDVYLIDMLGNIVKRWKLSEPPGNYGFLLRNGNLLYSGRTPTGEVLLGGKGGVLYEVNWQGDIVWDYRNDLMHHDFDRLPNGNTMALVWESVPAELYESIKGGVPGTEQNGVIWGDAILEVTPAGRVVWEWHAYEHLDGAEDSICPLCPRNQWTHANAIEYVELPGGKPAILISFRFQNTLALIDRSTGDWIWKWGRDDLGHQHDPTMLDSGNILVFDNGLHYLVNKKHMQRQTLARGTPRSRLLEVNPTTNDICWEYMGNPRYSFLSAFLSGAQRLPNGNTLACEGITGRFLEVSQDGEVVWEYIVPFYGNFRDFKNVNMCYRCYRYGADFPGFLGKDLDAESYKWLNHLLRTTAVT